MTVFEVSNEALKEFYLCHSPLNLAALIKNHCDQPPSTIAHWKKDQGVFYNEVETLSVGTDVKAFMDHYAGVLARTGWKVLV
jgi:hypothetical protein